MDLPQGTLLYNRYRVDSQLGAGGMGAVYLAFDTSLEAKVAVKVNKRATGESTTQFLREAHLLASLRNPNLPRVIDYFILDTSQYLVMDFIPGDDLANRLQKEGPQPVELVQKWAWQLGAALSYLHNQNPPIIHRDIKPANIKLTPDGDVVLVDFGIAKAADPSQATATGAAGYTPGFAPPEQYGGARTGPYSDQYSFAATLYMLITGQHPADSIQRVLKNSTLTPLRNLNPKVPVAMAEAIERALSVRPEDRFPSIQAMLQSMDLAASEDTQAIPDRNFTLVGGPVSPAAQISSTVVASKPTAAGATVAAPGTTMASAGETVAAAGATVVSPLSGQPAVRKGWLKWGVGGALALGACLVLGVAGGIFLAGKNGLLQGFFGPAPSPTALAVVVTAQPSETPVPPVPTAPEVIPTETAQIVVLPSETQAPPQATDTPAPPTATSAPVGGGGVIAFSSSREDGKTMQIWTMKVGFNTGGQVAAADFTQLTHGEGDKTEPRWSPDGKQILFVAPGGVVNGKNLGLDVWLMDASGGEPMDLTKRVGDDVDPAWSPDGKIIAFSNNGREDGVRQLFFMNPDGSSQTRISLDFNESMPIWAPDMKWLVYVISANNYPFLYMRSEKGSYKTPEPYDFNEITGRLGQVSQPAWSPDGSTIAYVRLDGGHKQVWSVIFSSRGGALSQLTNGSIDMDPAWSPDSRWILYSAMENGNREIFLMTSAGTLKTNLTTNSASDQQPAWQPLGEP